MDITLYYEEKGNGIPFVFLHGNNGNSNYFKHQMDYFKENYRVILVDTRGHGKSKRGIKPFTMDQFVEDLNYLLDKLNVQKIILLGFSDGANIAMKYALKHQNRLEALILNGGNINTKGIKKWFQIPVEIGYRITKLFNKKSEKIKRKNELLELMVKEPRIKLGDLHIIEVPTLVIAGTKDIVKESHTKLIADNIQNAKLLIIKGNHYIASNQSKIFNKEVDDFLKKK